MKTLWLLMFLMPCWVFASDSSFPEDRPSAGESCDDVSSVLEGESAMGSASLYSNLVGSRGSLKVESKRLMENVIERAEELPKPEKVCPPGCKWKAKPRIIFETAPNLYLDSYPDSKKCTALEGLTSKEPLNFEKEGLSSAKTMSSWFSDFSQGKGEHGKLLYERCDGQCSPRYKTEITNEESQGFDLMVEVVCGAARDKSDNLFQLRTYYIWECEPSSEKVETENARDSLEVVEGGGENQEAQKNE